MKNIKTSFQGQKGQFQPNYRFTEAEIDLLGK
jgi:hypothetical protein